MQANKDILLNAMDIFVKEPLLDWQTHANNKQSKLYKYLIILMHSIAKKKYLKLENRNSNEIGEGDSQTVEWYPRQKLDIARRKLELENPACILTF
jgi:DNA-dependent protein kinase catalytic subunit